MAQKYRKVDPRIWADEKFTSLSADEKLVALYCLTSSQVNRIGLFRFSPALAAEELETLPPTFAKRFERVCITLQWRFDCKYKVLYFPTWWKYNRPDNQNMLAACLSDLHDIPSTPLIVEFCNNTTYLPESFAEKLRNVTPNVPLNVTPNVRPQEQEQEQEQEQDISLPQAAPKKKFAPPTVDEVRDYCRTNDYAIDAERFVDFYASKGWVVGKVPMKDWQAAVRTWEKNNRSQHTGTPAPKAFVPRKVPAE